MKLNVVPAKTGSLWVRQGIRAFWKQPLALTGLFFMFMASMSILSIVPVLGSFLALMLLPAATLGLMAATREVELGKFPMPFILAAGFRTGPDGKRNMIVLGLIYAQTGLGLHPVVDKPLQLLGASFGPVALVLVGITLAQTPVGENFKGALKISVVKTFVHPMLMAAAGYAMGMRGLHLAVMVVAAALPIGANVFLFSQRYQKEEDVVTAAVAVSTSLALVSITLVMAMLPMLPA